MGRRAEYTSLLQDDQWAMFRNKIILLDEHKCQNCGFEHELQVHHIVYGYGMKPWEYEDENMITLCTRCHNDVEWIKGNLDEYKKWFNKMLIHRKGIMGPYRKQPTRTLSFQYIKFKGIKEITYE